MAKDLKSYLQQHIAQHGPINIGQFMSIALCHPEHGYYMKQDPFGKAGDFTTAPEISQMFGEVIGAWVADIWLQMGKPSPFGLVECGPGRGTLMEDILRACRGVEGFHEAVILHLIEISPVLKAEQAQKLNAFHPIWHQSLGAVPHSYPLIVLGNEFMDALPFRQLVKEEEGWAERVVTQDMAFGLRPAGPELVEFIPAHLQNAEAGSVFEISPTRIAAMQNICDLLERAGGICLLFDYGHSEPGLGDSFQALHNHEYVSVLDYLGDADLTSHVDFQAIEKAAKAQGAKVEKLKAQGDFLNEIGIQTRANYLIQKADEKQKSDIQSALKRLTSHEEMGVLFKAMAVRYHDKVKPAGFV